jgi:transglutaminase-like putative cysteine protease
MILYILMYEKITKSYLSFLTRGFLVFFLFLFFSVATISQAKAKDADIQRNSLMEIGYQNEDDFVSVTHTVSYQINNSRYLYNSDTKFTILLQDYKVKPDTSERAFKKSTLTISDTDRTSISDYSITEKAEGIEIKITRGREITSDSPYQIKIKYKTHELINQKGNIASIYIPGVSEKQTFENTDGDVTTSMDFNIKVTVPESTPAASEISPSQLKEEFRDKSRIYSINGRDLVGRMGWIQFGTTQYNYFKITQKAPKTDFLIPLGVNQFTDLLSTNIFKIVLPREYEETNQKVYYKSISPIPTKIELDGEGNLVAQFEVPANQDTEITAEGIITTEKATQSKSLLAFPDVSLVDYIAAMKGQSNEIFDYAKYTESDTFWQKDDPTIQAASQELATKNSNIRALVKADYDFVIDHMDYDYAKIDSTNPRLGAIAALSTGKGVCMEYADLMIAILRAQGIPARTAFGYGNDPLLSSNTDNNINTNAVTNSRIGHQWVQIWVDNYGWVSIDPTWGETGREYIGADLDHILWSAVSNLSSNSVFDTYLFSANTIDAQSLNSFDITLKTIKKSEFDSQMKDGSLKEISAFTPLTSNSIEIDKISTTIKTTPIGKALVIVLPSCIALLLLLILLMSLTKILQKVFNLPRKNKKKATAN